MVRAKKRFLDMMNLKKQLRRLVIPIFVELALVMMLGATDTIMLSRHSDNAVAAVGFDNQIISLVFLVYQFMSMRASKPTVRHIAVLMAAPSTPSAGHPNRPKIST